MSCRIRGGGASAQMSPAQQTPYRGFLSRTHLSLTSSSSGMSFDMYMSLRSGSADWRYAWVTSDVQMSEPWSTSRARRRRMDWRCVDVALLTIRCFILSLCPPMTNIALYFVWPSSFDLIARRKRPGRTLASLRRSFLVMWREGRSE